LFNTSCGDFGWVNSSSEDDDNSAENNDAWVMKKGLEIDLL
jgi:hypothetical protein